MAQDSQTSVRVRRLTKPGFLYPLKGITYFAKNRFLHPLLRGRLLPCFILSVLVLATLFIWTYLPQVAFLAVFHGKGGAWLNATFLVLGEGAAITALLFEAFLADETQLNIFDAVLVNEGFDDLVSASRPVEEATQSDGETLTPLQRLSKTDGSAIYAPFSFRQIIEFILLLPLNFVPWIGVPLFLWLTGYRAGPLQHWRFFELREYTKKERNAFIRKRRLGYTGFGTVHLVMQLIPGLSMLFLLTTAAGAGLWAADIQREEHGVAVPDEPPPEYSEYIDDPV